MKLPDTGAMIMDRKTSTCWKVEVSERRWFPVQAEAGIFIDEFQAIRLECVGYNGVDLILEDEDLHDDETRYVELEPLQVLEMAKHKTEQALSCSSVHLAKTQRLLCLEAIWLLQWFSAED